MSKKLHLYWYRLNEGHGNFGDEVNPYLIEKLSGNQVTWTSPYPGTRWESAKTVAYMILKEVTTCFIRHGSRFCIKIKSS